LSKNYFKNTFQSQHTKENPACMRSLEKLREWCGKKIRFHTTLEGAECLRRSDAGS